MTDAVGDMDAATHTYEPEWSADRAAEYLARWTRAARIGSGTGGDNDS